MALDINALVSKAFDIVKGVDPNLVETVTYNFQAADPTYDTTTGLTVEDLDPISSLDVVRTKLSEREEANLDANPDLEIRRTDRVYAIARNKLGRRPVRGDQIVLSDTTAWSVVGISAPPGDSLYKVVVRRP